MKNSCKLFFVVTLLFGVLFSFGSCKTDPTFGLEEITFEEILEADLYAKYNVSYEFITYNKDHTVKNRETSTGVLTSDKVKASLTGLKASIELAKVTHLAGGKVCADKNYKKIVSYSYTYDTDGNLTREDITTFKKI